MPLDFPDDKNFLKKIDELTGQIQKCRLVHCRTLMHMVIAMKSLTKEQEGEHHIHISRFIPASFRFSTKHMTKRINRPGKLVKEGHPQASAPEK